MRRLRLTALSLLVLTSSAAAQGGGADSLTWKRHVVSSKKLGEERPIFVSTPAGFSQTSRAAVLVLLDANDVDQFVAARANIRFLTSRGAIPPLIIVGVPNTKDRTHDLTPTPVGKEATGNPTAGGADNFADFIIDELLPYVRSQYHTLNTTVLAGHSYGGLFAVHVAATRPRAFTGIIAMSPSLQFNDSTLVATYADAIAHASNGPRLFATSGGLEPPIDVTTKRFAERLKSMASVKDAFEYKFYGNDNHGMTPQPSLVDGLRFVFAPLGTSRTIADAAFVAGDSASMMTALTEAESRFAAAARAFGYPELFPEQDLNTFGYRAMQSKQPRLAVWAFRRNVERYPASANTYDSFGDGLLAAGDTALAKIQFAKAVEVGTRTGDPIVPFSRDKLTALAQPALAGKPKP